MSTSEEDNVWSVRQTAGMVFQNPDNQIVATIVEEDVAFGPENLGVPTDEIWERVNKALESVNEIKELMEKSSKFISVSGLAAILAGIYALAGAYIATQVITPDTYLIVALELMAIIALSVLAAAAVTAGILSYCKSKKTGQKFFSRLTYRALWNFSLPMLTGGIVCISILMHEYYDILASVMLLFYGLALVNASKFTYSSVAWLGYAFICLGAVDCFWAGHSLLFWTIGFGGFHILLNLIHI